MDEKKDAKDEIADAKKRNERADSIDPPLGGGTPTPPFGEEDKHDPFARTSRVDAVEAAKLRARIESTPGGARYEEEQKAKGDAKDPGPQPGKGREEPPFGEDRKKYIVQGDEKLHIAGIGRLKSGDTVYLTDGQASFAGKNVKLK